MLQGSRVKMSPHWRFQEAHDDHLKCKLQQKIHTATWSVHCRPDRLRDEENADTGVSPPESPDSSSSPRTCLLPCVPLRPRLPSQRPRRTAGNVPTQELEGRVSPLKARSHCCLRRLLASRIKLLLERLRYNLLLFLTTVLRILHHI